MTELTSNEELHDAVLRHQIGLRRYTAGLGREVAALLEEADAELAAKLKIRLARFQGKKLDFTGERWKALLKEVRSARAEVLAATQQKVTRELTELAKDEAAREIAILDAAIPIEISLTAVSARALYSILSSQPFQGALLKDWFAKIKSDDQARLVRAIQLGMVQGEPIDDIVRRVVGTRKQKYADGILATTRRGAQAVVRTAVNHISNKAREAVWEANQDLIRCKIWSATLDGRTTAICRANDGRGASVAGKELPDKIKHVKPKGLEPPAHIGCRSIWVAYLDGVGLVGRRPTVTDTRTRQKREVDFRKIARQTGRPIQDVRAEWAKQAVGGVPAEVNYQQFLSRQPVSFQDDVLGATRGKLFRDGGVKLDQFIDHRGQEYTLAELRSTRPEAFIRAGL